MGALLEVKNLKTYFFTRDGVVKAVDGVSFHLNEGETLGLVGESGCGKSVSQLSIMRLIPNPPGKIMDGEVIFQGQDLLQIPDGEMRKVRGNRIAMVFQEPMTSLNPVLTISHQIVEALLLHRGMDRAAARAETLRLLNLVGIPDAERRMDDYPHQFSGGMRQRVMIAMALSCNPKLLIADEPTTAVDVTIQAQLLEIVKDLTKRFGTAVVIVTHNLGVVARYADRVNVMYAGRIIETGTATDIYGDPRHPYTVGLLASVPRLDQPRTTKLVPIDGQPPDLVALPAGCSFRPRCTYLDSSCQVDRPPLREVTPGHWVSCWTDVRGKRG